MTYVLYMYTNIDNTNIMQSVIVELHLDIDKLIHQKEYVTHTLAKFMNGLKIAMFA